MKAPPALNDRVRFERRTSLLETQDALLWDEGDGIEFEGGEEIEAAEPVAGDGAGNFDAEWSPIGPAAVRVAIDELRLGAGEDVLQGKLQGHSLVNVTLRQSRFTHSLSTEDRLVDLRSGVVMNIRNVPLPTRETFITLICEAGVAT